jgi:plasmid stabilization system protein ParE
MSYRILEPALDDLDSIDDWVFTNFGERAATRAREKLDETFKLLANFHQMGIADPDITEQSIRLFSVPPNWIVYEPGDPLLIHRVYPAALDIKTLKL